MSQQFVHGTTMLQILINPKHEMIEFQNYCWKLNVPISYVLYYNSEYGIKIKKFKGRIFGISIVNQLNVLTIFLMVLQSWKFISSQTIKDGISKLL